MLILMEFFFRSYTNRKDKVIVFNCSASQSAGTNLIDASGVTDTTAVLSGRNGRGELAAQNIVTETSRQPDLLHFTKTIYTKKSDAHWTEEKNEKKKKR